jgi:hypothetical protein
LLKKCRKEKREKGEKEKKKKNREEPEEEGEWSRYGRSSRKPSSGIQKGGFRHEERLPHIDHERWNVGQSRDRFPGEHKRDRFDYQRQGGYHRERVDFRSADKRFVSRVCRQLVMTFVDVDLLKEKWTGVSTPGTLVIPWPR